MFRRPIRILLLIALSTGGGYGLFRYQQSRSTEARLNEQIHQLEAQRKHLADFVTRLTSEKRVADMVVTDQVKKGDEIESTTLMFVEYGRDGLRLPPRFFTVLGNGAHIDALVIKFDRGFIESDDPLRGHSIALFYRLFGEKQAPADGFRIDTPGKSPEVYRDPSKESAATYAFEQELWTNFWKLADDEKYRGQKGVRVAQGESPWTYFYPEKVYTLSLETAGGLSLVSRPMDGLYREFLSAVQKQREQAMAHSPSGLTPQ